MSALFLAQLLLTAAVLGLVALAVFLRRDSRFAEQATLEAAYMARQIRQIDADAQLGILGKPEAEETRSRIARALLSAEHTRDEGTSVVSEQGERTVVLAGLALAGVVAFVLYGLTGSPETPDLPLAERQDLPVQAGPSLASDHEGSSMRDAIATLEDRLRKTPEDREGWLLLARSQLATGLDAEAASSLRRLLELGLRDPAILGDYGEALVRASGGAVSQTAADAFDEVLEADPADPRANYYVALRDAQLGNSVAAVRRWEQILAAAPPDAPYIPAVRSIAQAVIEDAALDPAEFDLAVPAASSGVTAPRGPTQQDIEAASQMSDDDQLEMIRSMVGQLEERLAENPQDVEGWLMLIRSRGVLGEPDRAAEALDRALAANPDEPRLADIKASMVK